MVGDGGQMPLGDALDQLKALVRSVVVKSEAAHEQLDRGICACLRAVAQCRSVKVGCGADVNAKQCGVHEAFKKKWQAKDQMPSQTPW